MSYTPLHNLPCLSCLTPRPEGAQGNEVGKDKIKSKVGSTSHKTSLHSPESGLRIDDLHSGQVSEDSSDDLSIIDDSPGSEPSSILGEGAEFSNKMSVYSPSQERFSIPEDIGTEAQTSSSLSTSAISDVQGAKLYMGQSEFSPTSTAASSEANTSFFSPSTTQSYSFSQPSPVMSPTTYPVAFNPQGFPTGSTDGVMTAGTMYPNGPCMSPSAYMGPYGVGKPYTWSSTPNTYGSFGMNSHDLMPSGYSATTYQPAPYSPVPRPGYTYFPSPVPTSTAHTS